MRGAKWLSEGWPTQLDVAHASVIEGRRIGDDGATIGIGAVVIKDVEPEAIIAGNPAQPTTEIGRVNRAIAHLIADEDET